MPVPHLPSTPGRKGGKWEKSGLKRSKFHRDVPTLGSTQGVRGGAHGNLTLNKGEQLASRLGADWELIGAVDLYDFTACLTREGWVAAGG